MIKKLGWRFWLYVAAAASLAGAFLVFTRSNLAYLILETLSAGFLVTAVVFHWILKAKRKERIAGWALPAVCLSLCLVLCSVWDWIQYLR